LVALVAAFEAEVEALLACVVAVVADVEAPDAEVAALVSLVAAAAADAEAALACVVAVEAELAALDAEEAALVADVEAAAAKAVAVVIVESLEDSPVPPTPRNIPMYAPCYGKSLICYLHIANKASFKTRKPLVRAPLYFRLRQPLKHQRLHEAL
jgi:hypothetical protein